MDPLGTDELKDVIKQSFEEGFGSTSLYLVDKNMLKAFTNMPQVYFLCDGPKNEIVYIGQTKNLYARIFQHMQSNKKFHSYMHIPVCSEHLDFIEQWLINMYKPIYNERIMTDFRERVIASHFGNYMSYKKLNISPELSKCMYNIMRANIDTFMENNDEATI